MIRTWIARTRIVCLFWAGRMYLVVEGWKVVVIPTLLLKSSFSAVGIGKHKMRIGGFR